jgi:hypothetical protein
MALIMQRATFKSMTHAACFAYFAVITRGGKVRRFFKAGRTYFVYFEDCGK